MHIYSLCHSNISNAIPIMAVYHRALCLAVHYWKLKYIPLLDNSKEKNNRYIVTEFKHTWNIITKKDKILMKERYHIEAIIYNMLE